VKQVRTTAGDRHRIATGHERLGDGMTNADRSPGHHDLTHKRPFRMRMRLRRY
jgi:hypothetical protein